MDAAELAWLRARQAHQDADAAASIEPCPCEGCARAARCAAELLACSAFERFDAGLRWQLSPRTDASRERYAAIFGSSRT
ncbi:MAG: hypothetical protein ACREU2_09980 [Steroidobacteraceae bacterium]